MSLELQRLFTLLIMPLPVALLLFLLAALLWYGRRVLFAKGLFACAVLCLWLPATPWFSGWLVASLEVDFPPVAAADCDTAASDDTAIVLLGGAMRRFHPHDTRARIAHGSDRVWHAARLFHAGCGSVLVIAGGGFPSTPFEQTEAAAMRSLLRDFSVPDEAMLHEAQSRTTQENAHYAYDLVQQADVSQVLLVTSAWHMRRALGIFQLAGFDAQPAAADYRSMPPCPARRLHCWLPGGERLWQSELAIKEYLGYWAQVTLKTSAVVF